ncbi:hypothetical protein PVN37_15170 [Bacillus licheniformis]|nr:hypothetical protein [Bacillus licheniformis]MDE1420748.1 hypothetical protein [Bacillus licheniformis]MDE1428043.1 hypothetical protein [Bacillus licheniformis]
MKKEFENYSAYLLALRMNKDKLKSFHFDHVLKRGYIEFEKEVAE